MHKKTESGFCPYKEKGPAFRLILYSVKLVF